MKKLSNYWFTLLYFLRLLIITLYCRTIIKEAQPLELLGSVGASWWIPKNQVKKDWVIYSGGVGEDISFDQELIKKYACTVFAFDPTPRAVAYADKHTIKNFIFFPIGLWKENRILKFFSPADTKNVSHSIVNLQKTVNYFKAPCITIKSVMSRLGHTKIDLLKLDIEGAEFPTIDRMLADGIYPNVLAIEFDQPKTANEMISYINKLISYQYTLIKQDHFNFTFMHID